MAKRIAMEVYNLGENENRISFDVRVKTIKDTDIVLGTLCRRIFDWFDLQKECHAQGLRTRHVGVKWSVTGKVFDTSAWDIRLQEKLNMGYSAKAKLRFMRRFKVCYEMISKWAADEKGVSFAQLESEMLAALEVVEMSEVA
jgi:predicted secreted protein